MASTILKDVPAEDSLDTSVCLFQPDNLGIAGRLFVACANTFRTILEDSGKSKALTKQQAKRLRRSCGLLQQWGDYHRALRGDLDLRLQKSRELQRATIGLLRGIGENLYLSMLLKPALTLHLTS